MEVERVYREWDVNLEWAPFFLDPSIPPEGRTRTPTTTPDTPPSTMELRGEALGVKFARGRTFQPHTHRALEAGEWVGQHGNTEQVIEYHRRLFRVHFTDHESLMNLDVLAREATATGLDGAALCADLESGALRDVVDEGIEHAYAIGVTAIPTFIFDDKYAVVGAHEYPTFVNVLEQLGARRRDVPLPQPPEPHRM